MIIIYYETANCCVPAQHLRQNDNADRTSSPLCLSFIAKQSLNQQFLIWVCYGLFNPYIIYSNTITGTQEARFLIKQQLMNTSFSFHWPCPSNVILHSLILLGLGGCIIILKFKIGTFWIRLVKIKIIYFYFS